MMNLEKARECAAEENKYMAASEFDSDVLVEHRDGTKLEFTNAHICRIDSEWVSIHTEHCGYHVFHISDLTRLRSITEEEWLVGDALEDE